MKENFSPTFEQDLIEYCKTGNEQLFNDKLYVPLRSMAIWIINNHKHDYAEMDDLIQILLTTAISSLRKYDYNQNKMKAVSWCNWTMEQSLMQKYHYSSCGRRNYVLSNSLEETIESIGDCFPEETKRNTIEDIYALGKWIEDETGSFSVHGGTQENMKLLGQMLQGKKEIVYNPNHKDTVSCNAYNPNRSTSSNHNSLRSLAPIIKEHYPHYNDIKEVLHDLVS